MSYQDIHASDVGELLKTPGLTVIDMRDEVTRSRGHLPSAIPHSDEVIGGLVRQRHSNHAVLVYCYHGISSRDLCSFLAQLGLENVYNLEGGWQAWEAWKQKMQSQAK